MPAGAAGWSLVMRWMEGESNFTLHALGLMGRAARPRVGRVWEECDEASGKYGSADRREEIRPGQADPLYWTSRIAPGFINAQLEKGSKDWVPPPGE
jgi:hypothetical protein